MCESMQKCSAFFCRKVELARTTIGDVNGNNPRNFVTERLDGNYNGSISMILDKWSAVSAYMVAT